VVSPPPAPRKPSLRWRHKKGLAVYIASRFHPDKPPVIRAELEGSRCCAALGFSVDAHAPFLAPARKLIQAGFDPSCILEAYRGATLCLRAELGVAAKLTVEDDRNGTPRFRQDRAQSVVAGPPVTPTGLRAIQRRDRTQRQRGSCPRQTTSLTTADWGVPEFRAPLLSGDHHGNRDV
jgi:hypothetical protein